MDKTTLTISLPRTMKDFIATKIREGRFSTPSEYIRSLIRDDQDVSAKGDLALWLRRGGALAHGQHPEPARAHKKR